LTYVQDTVSGFVDIAGCDAAIGRAVNIGRGEDLSIGELVDLIGRRMGRPIRVEAEERRVRPAASEVERLLAGTNLARELWGWRPRYTMAQGLDETIAWIRENPGRFRVDAYAT
jgi:dTDP-glucose 4,6-dehydratase